MAEELQEQGFEIGPAALRRILFSELGLSRRQAYQDEVACKFEQRDEQFQSNTKLRAEYERNDWPVLSIDTEKKEILGDSFSSGPSDHETLVTAGRFTVSGTFSKRIGSFVFRNR